MKNIRLVVFDNVTIFPVCVHLGEFFDYKPGGVGTYFILRSRPTGEFRRRVMVSYDSSQMTFVEAESDEAEFICETASWKEAHEALEA